MLYDFIARGRNNSSTRDPWIFLLQQHAQRIESRLFQIARMYKYRNAAEQLVRVRAFSHVTLMWPATGMSNIPGGTRNWNISWTYKRKSIKSLFTKIHILPPAHFTFLAEIKIDFSQNWVLRKARILLARPRYVRKLFYYGIFTETYQQFFALVITPVFVTFMRKK